eukprot:TRINITY_DN3318_c0_g1_i2.p1 TRINITY_DN3318_c0_g1~~TRINITY_DN3318_c0_g1_i2.p1  ORF type:complete len:139 (+),score=9.99 TRINITY_DN3318_c0_g1_i2:803-1219(+)
MMEPKGIGILNQTRDEVELYEMRLFQTQVQGATLFIPVQYRPNKTSALRLKPPYSALIPLLYIEYGKNFNSRITQLPPKIEEVTFGRSYQQQIGHLSPHIKFKTKYYNFYLREDIIRLLPTIIFVPGLGWNSGVMFWQ